MKLSVFIFAVATALVSTAQAANCDPKLVDAVAIPEQEKCETESGFRFIPLTIPTEDVKAKFCKSDACLAIWTAAKGAAPEECMIKGKELYADILDPLSAACKKTGTAGNATAKVDHSHSGGSKGSHGSGMGKKNKTSHHGSGSEDSSDDDSAIKATANSTTKPTTAPSSAGAMASLSITAGVTALAIASVVFL